MHKKDNKTATRSSDELVFELKSIFEQPDAGLKKSARGQASKSSHKKASYSTNVRAENHPADDSAASSGKKKKLDTSYTKDARGMSHVQRKKNQTRRDLTKVVCAILTVLFVITAAAMFRSYTRIKTISVVGSQKYGEEQLLSLSGLKIGKSIFSYSADEVTYAMDSIPDIHTKSVKKSFPNRIEIIVEDVTARAALLGSNENYTVISADGYVMSIGSERPDGLLEVRGLSGCSFALNTYMDQTDRNIRTVGAIDLIKALDESGLKDSVLYIDVSSATYTVLGLKSNYEVVLGAITTAPDCLYAASEAYQRFLPVYPDGGTLNVYSNSSIVDFTPVEPIS